VTLALIQARLGSHRFPNKVLADLCGWRVIDHVIERVQQISGVDHVLVAWPDACWYAGHENDVLGRFAHVVMQYPDVDTVLRATADCPVLDSSVCERVLELYHGTPNCEYAWTNTRDGEWPDGLDCEVFSRAALMWAHREATDPADREHVTPWLRRHVKVASLPPDPKYRGWPKLSIDTPEDLDRVRAWMTTH
jgi:spore coat polysaccharide biosynthesis protein SpsF (cytidylyltransferase family)